MPLLVGDGKQPAVQPFFCASDQVSGLVIGTLLFALRLKAVGGTFR
jgi:hypothetical protein